MRIKLHATGFLLVFSFIVFGGLQAQYVENQTDPNVKKFPVSEVQLSGVTTPTPEDDWDPSLKNISKIHVPGVDLRKDEFLKIKQEANDKKQEAIEKGTYGIAPSSKAASTNPPTIGTQFFGNNFNGGIPNDNNIAVSAAGAVVSVTNTRMYMYNASGMLLTWTSLQAFSNGAAGVKSNTKFDPKITYDPDNDRFVLVYLNGGSPSTSQIVVCFSQTNDPTGNWNIYAFNGNVGGGVWSDYPSIGISTDELFVTTNLFTSQGAATGAAVWQIDLSDGYAGNALTNQVYQAPYFSLSPVEGGLNMYGPHFYLLRTGSSGGNQVSIHRITNTIGNNGTLESPVTFQTEGYSVPPSADQLGTNTDLMTGDCRLQNSYLENNRIQYVMNTSVGGRPSIYYGTIVISPFDLTFSAASGKQITFSDLEIAYPGVAYAGIQGNTGDNASFVSFNFCSSVKYAGNAAVYIDENENISTYVILRNGSGPVGGGAQYRWGDYADIQERPGTTGEAWVGASYAMTSGNTMTYISQITTPLPLGNEQDAPAVTDAQLDVYPNPTTDNVNFDFTVSESGNYEVSLYSLDGKLVRNLVSEYLREGKGRASFNTSPLSNGTYLVVVTRDQQRIFEEKLVVSH